MRTTDQICAVLVAVFILAILMVSLYAHPTPTPKALNTAAQTDDPAETMPGPMTMAMNPVDEFPNYHPLVVHFPIVLLLAAALFQITSFFAYRKEFSVATMILLLAGTISVWLASNTFHAHPSSLPEPLNALYESHELMAKYTWWLALAALVAKVVSHFFIKRKWWSEAVVLILLIGASITVSIAGHHGAQLVHMGGVGPQGNYLESH